MSLIFEGKTESEAISNACRILGTEESNFTYKIIEKNSGAWGSLIGKSKIKIEVFMNEQEASDSIVKPTPAIKPKQANDNSQNSSDKASNDSAIVKDPDKSAKARDTINELIRLIGIEGNATVVKDDEIIELNIESNDDNLVIGKGGVVLDSLQYIVNKIVTRYPAGGKLIVLDAGGYRKKRTDSLEALAKRTADRVLQTGNPAKLRNLSARDRRIVHLFIQNMHGVYTQSRGEGRSRYMLILPEK